MQPDNQTISGQLRKRVRESIDEDGWSVLGLANAMGVKEPSLHRWLAGTQPELKTTTIDKMAAFYGMRLTKGRRPKPVKR